MNSEFKIHLKFLEISSILIISLACGLMVYYGRWEMIKDNILVNVASVALMIIGIIIWCSKENWSERFAE